MNKKPIPHSSRGSKLIVKQTNEIFISQLNDQGLPTRTKCPLCWKWYENKKRHDRSCKKVVYPVSKRQLTKEVKSNE